MRKVLFLSLIPWVLIAAAPIVEIPSWVIQIFIVALIPLLVEGIHWLITKWPKLEPITGKAGLTTIAFVVSIGVVLLFLNWGDISALPPDPMQAAITLIGYAGVIFAGATGFYNLLYSALLNAWAKKNPSGQLAYRLET